MDRRNWLWRRKSSSEKSPGETESTRSVSSERYSDEQEILRPTPTISSPNHAQSPEVSSKDASGEAGEIVKNLNEKLSAALLSANAKGDLVKQHSKLTEEAVLGWEMAEKEVSSLKLQLDTTKRKNSSLEDKIRNLDEALKECVRQLQQSREEQEKAVLDAVMKANHEWDSEKSDLQLKLTELQAQLEAKTETKSSHDHDLRSKLEVVEKENSALKVKLASITRDIQMSAMEIELSTKAAETASKQHLESIKKVTKLEAECRRLHASARKSFLSSEQKFISNSSYVESCTDSQSDSGERFLSLDNEPSCSDSWASALMSELDQFKNGKSSVRLSKSVDIELIDDFLEMEKLAALPESDNASSSFNNEAKLNCCFTADSSYRNQIETMRQRILELEGNIEKMTSDKVYMEMSLLTNHNQLKIIKDQVENAKIKVDDLQRQLNVVNMEKHDLQIELETAETKRHEAEYMLDVAHNEIGQLQINIQSSHEKFVDGSSLSAEFAARYPDIDGTKEKIMEMELELEVAYREISKLQESMNSLEKNVEKEKTLSAELELRCQHMDSLEANKKELESQLELTTIELRNMHEKVELYEWKIESIEAKATELEYLLNSANIKFFMSQEKVNTLEARVEDERMLSKKLAANLETEEGKQRELVSQLEFAHKEVGNLQNKLVVLGEQIVEERAFSAEFEAKYRSLESKFENAEEKRKALDSELQLARKETLCLQNNLHLLEKQVEEEKILSAELAAKYHALQYELLREKKKAELQQSATRNYTVKIRQDKDFALSAGKLVECQKTIASLNRQLKSLASLDDFILATEESMKDADPLEDRGKLRSAVTYGSP